MHKRTGSFISTIFFGLILSCNDGTLFHIELEEQSTTDVSGTGLLGEATELVGSLGFSGFTQMNLVQSEELQNQGVEPGDIETTYIVSLNLNVLSPEGGDLSFLEEMNIYISAPGLDEVLVASLDDFPVGASRVDFEIEDVNLVDYVVSEELSITTDVVGTAPQDDTTVEANILLDIGVTAQGACNATK